MTLSDNARRQPNQAALARRRPDSRGGVEVPDAPASNRAVLRNNSAVLRVVAAAAFIIYASAVLVLRQQDGNSFCCERIGLAAALSHAVYQAPLGKVYPEIQTQLNDTQAPVEALLDRAAHLVPPPDKPTTAINDGNGIGFILVANWAIHLFGPHLSSLPLFMLVLMAFSAATFLWRFQDERSAVVTTTFFSLTLMLCTPLAWDPVIASQIPIGGIRYYSLLAVVPAFHVVLELADRDGHADEARPLHLILLGVQVIILVISVLVRGSAAYVAGPILLVGVAKAWRNRHDGHELHVLRREAIVIALVSVSFIGSLLLALPKDFIREGRLATTTEFWHRAVVSLGINPAWPFGNLREIYDCKSGNIPEGLIAAPVDRNGHCIWWSYLTTHNIPTAGALAEMYGSRYEAAQRGAFFNIARLYPHETLATFFYYKPKWFANSLAFLTLNPSLPSDIVRLLVIGGFLNFLGLFIIASGLPTGYLMLFLTGLGAIFGISCIPTYLVAWATPHTMADVLFYCLFCTGLGTCAGLQGVRAAIRRSFARPARP